VEPSRQPSCGRTEGRKHATIGRVPIPNRGGGGIGLAIVGNPENDGRLPPWQEAVWREIILDARRNGCSIEARMTQLMGELMVRNEAPRRHFHGSRSIGIDVKSQ
jgi:hypothetical protein